MLDKNPGLWYFADVSNVGHPPGVEPKESPTVLTEAKPPPKII